MSQETDTLDIIVGFAAKALDWTKDRVRLAIVEGVMHDPELLQVVHAENRRVAWAVGWKEIAGVLDKSVSTVLKYKRDDYHGFRSLIGYTKTGSPKCRRDRLEEWMMGRRMN